MKALAGPAMLLVIFGGYGIHKWMSKDDAPSRDFTGLELAAADDRGTCYALSTVLVANGVFSNATRTWSAPDSENENKWMLTLEQVHQGYNGPVHVFQKLTFERAGEQVRLTSVEASKGQSTEIAAYIDGLLEAPHDLKSTPVDRCLGEKGSGYQYPPPK